MCIGGGAGVSAVKVVLGTAPRPNELMEFQTKLHALVIPLLNNLALGVQVTVSKDDTVVLDGAGDKKAIEERCEQVCLGNCLNFLRLMPSSASLYACYVHLF